MTKLCDLMARLLKSKPVAPSPVNYREARKAAKCR